MYCNVFIHCIVTSSYIVFPLQVSVYFKALTKDNFKSLADSHTFIPRCITTTTTHARARAHTHTHTHTNAYVLKKLCY